MTRWHDDMMIWWYDENLNLTKNCYLFNLSNKSIFCRKILAVFHCTIPWSMTWNKCLEKNKKLLKLSEILMEFAVHIWKAFQWSNLIKKIGIPGKLNISHWVVDNKRITRQHCHLHILFFFIFLSLTTNTESETNQN